MLPLRRWTGAVAGALVALAAMGECVAAAQSPALAQLAFGFRSRIYVIKADGSEPRALTGALRGAVASDAQPAWSPDGSTLAFTRGFRLAGADDRSQIYLVSADGSGQRALTRPAHVGDGSPAWSPDGRKLAFARFVLTETSGTSSIIVIGRNGGRERLLTRQRLLPRFESVGEPRWSPDGKRIAFTRVVIARHGYFHPTLYVVGSGGGKPRVLAREASSPSWSPDGSKIAFMSVRDRNGDTCGEDECRYNGEIYVMNADGTGQVRLTSNKGSDEEPQWSPDGGRIAFSSDRNYPDGESPEIYSIKPDGSCLTWLTNGVPGSSYPAWRPGSVASSDPGRCGATARAPAIAISLAAARSFTGHTLYWLGYSDGNLLLSDFSLARTGAFFEYDDCGSFDPGACPPSLQLNEGSVCDGDSVLPLIGGGADRLLKLRGALVADFGGEGGVVIYTGTTEIHLNSGVFLPDEKKAVAQLLSIVNRLQPTNAQPPATGELPGPVVPAPLAQKLERTLAAFRRLGTVGAVHRRLKISRTEVHERLRLAQALLSFGPIETVPCNPPAPNQVP